MGNRRIGRKRLYAVEKAGQLVDLESGAGIASAIKAATQHRNGQEIITEIQIDLAASTGVCKGGNGVKKVVGIKGSTAPAYITQLSVAKFGIITEIRCVCVESLTTAVKLTDVMTDNDGTKALGDLLGSSEIVVCDNDGVIGDDQANTNTFDGNMQDSTPAYLYLANGGSNTSNSDFAEGKFLIYIHGMVAPADL